MKYLNKRMHIFMCVGIYIYITYLNVMSSWGFFDSFASLCFEWLMRIVK